MNLLTASALGFAPETTLGVRSSGDSPVIVASPAVVPPVPDSPCVVAAPFVCPRFLPAGTARLIFASWAAALRIQAGLNRPVGYVTRSFQ